MATEKEGIKSLLPAFPPRPPLPRIVFERGSSPPELPKIPKEMEEAEDVVASIFQVTRGVHSTMQTRRQIDELLRKPTKVIPFGEE